MLCFDSSGILQSHIPAGKWHHARVMGAVKGMKWCLFCIHAIPHGSQQKSHIPCVVYAPLSLNLRDLPLTNGLVTHWSAYYQAVPVAGCPRRWALPCHFPDCSHERVLLPESFRGVAPSVDPASPVLTSAWLGGRSPLSCIELSNASAVHSSTQANDGMPSWLHYQFASAGRFCHVGPA